MIFIEKHFELILGIIAVTVFIILAARALKKARKIEEEGIMTDAVISRIEEIWDPDTASSSYTTYVRYKDENGQLRESPMSIDTGIEYTEGDKVRIRFLPGDYEMVRIVKDK
ncbi:MAG: hypothetical protein IJJ00_05610 [Erysipelotrichaceae bacterium]|nr:hypothetical protein [Erysipelotrichaceae bacterium]